MDRVEIAKRLNESLELSVSKFLGELLEILDEIGFDRFCIDNGFSPYNLRKELHLDASIYRISVILKALGLKLTLAPI